MFYFLFLQVLRCFSSLGSPAFAYSSRSVFPHSDICGSRLICSSPQLFAAYRVLLRLPMPRHSPYALFSLYFMSFANLFYVQSAFVTLLSHCLDLSIFHSLRCSICYPMCFHIVCKYYSICFFSICVLFSFQSTASTASAVWWAQVGSNHRPCAYQAHALAC